MEIKTQTGPTIPEVYWGGPRELMPVYAENIRVSSESKAVEETIRTLLLDWRNKSSRTASSTIVQVTTANGLTFTGRFICPEEEVRISPLQQIKTLVFESSALCKVKFQISKITDIHILPNKEDEAFVKKMNEMAKAWEQELAKKHPQPVKK